MAATEPDLDLDAIETMAARGARPNAHVVRALIAEIRLLRGYSDADTETAATMAARAFAAEAERDALAARLAAVRSVPCWTNEDGKRFVFADDMRAALDREL